MARPTSRTRWSILDAIRKRHTYGAMDNIVMEVRMGRHFMGDEFSLKRAEPIKVKVIGTDNLAEIVIVKDGKVIYSAQPNKRDAQFDFIDNGEVTGLHYYYVRGQQANRLLAWSSPFFVN